MKFIDYFVDRMWEYLLGFIFGVLSFGGVAYWEITYIHSTWIGALLSIVSFGLLVTGSIWVHWKAHGRMMERLRDD